MSFPPTDTLTSAYTYDRVMDKERKVDELLWEGDTVGAAVASGVPSVDGVRVEIRKDLASMQTRYYMELRVTDSHRPMVYAFNVDDNFRSTEPEAVLAHHLSELLTKVSKDFYVIPTPKTLEGRERGRYG